MAGKKIERKTAIVGAVVLTALPEVLRGLKRQAATKNIPVIMVSSKGEDTDVRWGLRQGAADYVTKPFTPESVLAAVGKQL